mmetsp:Transcript_23356/g.49002  ORF Transcript_23356/g.49002 Transcript_23356/m.49002 type:complete len:336 (-) Transcript_23356:192-1199(-)
MATRKKHHRFVTKAWVGAVVAMMILIPSFIDRIILCSNQLPLPEKQITNGHQNQIFKNATHDQDLDDIVRQQTKRMSPNGLILHAISIGNPRSASTLQFNAVCVSLFLHILNFAPALANNTSCIFVGGLKKFKKKEKQRSKSNPQVIKMHFKPNCTEVLNDTWLFSTARDLSDGREEKSWLIDHCGTQERIGYIQDLETLSEIGLDGILRKYGDVFSLEPHMMDAMIEYFDIWDKLRVCCGRQMSKYWRNDLLPTNSSLKDATMKKHSLCPTLVIDDVEKQFMETKLYKLLHLYENMRPINRPSMVDEVLTGKYCSEYNDAVKSRGIGFNQGLQT